PVRRGLPPAVSRTRRRVPSPSGDPASASASESSPTLSCPTWLLLPGLFDVSADFPVERVVHLNDHGLAGVGLAVTRGKRDLERELGVLHLLDLEPDGIRVFGTGVDRRPVVLEVRGGHRVVELLRGPLSGGHAVLKLTLVGERVRVSAEE